MSKLSAKADKGRVQIDFGVLGHDYRNFISVEESRLLRAELERAEEEAGKKSAYQEWMPCGSKVPLTMQAWNAAIDAALAKGDGLYVSTEELRALREEPGE